MANHSRFLDPVLSLPEIPVLAFRQIQISRDIPVESAWANVTKVLFLFRDSD